MELKIVDPQTGFALEDPSVPGEIAVRGATLMSGYYKMDREIYFDADGFFHTQDGGFIDAEGFLHWTGRLSNLIKTGGANVSPLEIENLTCQFSEVHIAAALGIPHPTLGEAIVLCVVRTEGSQIDEAQVLSRLRKKLSAYKVPRKVLFPAAKTVQYTANQKLQVEPLRAWVQAELSEGEVEIAGFVY
jgi:fatty-acyl-CoA synthase